MARTQQQDEDARRQAEQEAQRQAALEAERQRTETAQQQDQQTLRTGVRPASDAARQREEARTPRVPGRYIRGARVAPDGRHMGGQVVNSDGVVLAEFPQDAENTGNPEDGKKPE